MTVGEVRELFAYGGWANALVFEAAASLPEEALGRSVTSSFASVRETLAHIAGAEWIWLRRWTGESPSAAPGWVATRDLAELRARLTDVERERDAFVAGLADADLERAVLYRTLGGQPQSDPLGALIRHVVNHSTYHRGQVATQLRQLGVRPPGTDLIPFLRQSPSRAAPRASAPPADPRPPAVRPG